MYRMFFLTGLLTLAGTAAAQQTPPPADHSTHPAPSAQSPAASQAPATPPAASRAPATPPATSQAPAAAGRPATAAEVGAMVTSEFPRRDADSNGSLNRDEFKSWLTELIAAGPGQSATNPAPDLDARIATAFTMTDADRSQGISPAEMTALLARGR